MKRLFGFCIFAALNLALIAGAASPAMAQSKRDECAIYQTAVVNGPAIPEKLLAGWQAALPCLLDSLEFLKGSFLKVDRDSTARAQFVRAAGSIRIILSSNDPDSVKVFRQLIYKRETLEAISALTFGARTDDDYSRQHSTLILGYVVDDATVCVPIDHLYASNISDSGRANLLAIVAVAAPSVAKENSENIERLLAHVSDQLKGRPGVGPVLATLEKMRRGLDQNQHKDTPIKEGQQNCKRYKPQFAKGDQLKY